MHNALVAIYVEIGMRGSTHPLQGINFSLRPGQLMAALGSAGAVQLENQLHKDEYGSWLNLWGGGRPILRVLT